MDTPNDKMREELQAFIHTLQLQRNEPVDRLIGVYDAFLNLAVKQEDEELGEALMTLCLVNLMAVQYELLHSVYNRFTDGFLAEQETILTDATFEIGAMRMLLDSMDSFIRYVADLNGFSVQELGLVKKTMHYDDEGLAMGEAIAHGKESVADSIVQGFLREVNKKKTPPQS